MKYIVEPNIKYQLRQATTTKKKTFISWSTLAWNIFKKFLEFSHSCSFICSLYHRIYLPFSYLKLTVNLMNSYWRLSRIWYLWARIPWKKNWSFFVFLCLAFTLFTNISWSLICYAFFFTFYGGIIPTFRCKTLPVDYFHWLCDLLPVFLKKYKRA